MCGIYAFWGKLSPEGKAECFKSFMQMSSRGPDSSFFGTMVRDKLTVGFHRLAINGLDMLSNQPLELDQHILLCNGEIFNYKELVKEHRLEVTTHSDCEVILHLYKLYGIDETIKMLDGEFAFILYDREKDELFVGRDHLGIRPLFYDTHLLTFASEAKAFCPSTTVQQFPPRTWWSSETGFHPYYDFSKKSLYYPYPQRRLRYLLEEAVCKRVHNTDVEVGCLLSGGLDSSIVASIAVKELASQGKTMKTFCIGLGGSPDLEAAAMVAKHIGTEHKSVVITEKDVLDAVRPTIQALESDDVTTIRASISHRLVAMYVSEQSSVKVLLSGEVADELSGSYAYFANAPDDESFHRESIRLLKDIHYFDGLRADRCVAAAGLELRVPFSDKNFVDFYTTLEPDLLRQDVEKQLLRDSCADLLPEFILKRRKNGFSDSVTSSKRSLGDIIREHYGLKDYKEEMEFYHNIYLEYYHDSLVPYQWKPKWSEQEDPSGRLLSHYEGD